MEALKFKKPVSVDIIVSSLFRAAVDCRAYGLIKNELIDLVLDELKKKEDEDFYFLMIDVIKKILPIFSAINLEDIKAPECFVTERALIAAYDFPVFHDDQHGTAIVSCAAMINSLKLLKK